MDSTTSLTNKRHIIPLISKATALITMLILLDIRVSAAAQPCTQIRIDDHDSCRVCELEQDENFSCYATLSVNLLHPIQLDYDQCISHCCQEQNDASFCQMNIRQLSENSTNIDSGKADPKIFIVAFVTAPIIVCLCWAISKCVKKSCQNPAEPVSHPQTATNLQHYDLDSLWPYYLDQLRACPICLDAKCNIITRCGHLYHQPCLAAWIQKRSVCPLCISQAFSPIAVYCCKCNRSVQLRLVHKALYGVAREEIKCIGCVSIANYSLSQQAIDGQIK